MDRYRLGERLHYASSRPDHLSTRPYLPHITYVDVIATIHFSVQPRQLASVISFRLRVS